VLVYLLCGLAGVAGLGLLGWGLHRLALWLEARGLLYYRRRPGGGGGRWLVLQEFYEPRAEHVIEARQAVPHVEHEGDASERLFPRLVACLRDSPPDRVQVRAILAVVRQAGDDPRAFYEQATAWVVQDQPALAGTLPVAEEVLPGDG
jgi:hypothetical protein